MAVTSDLSLIYILRIATLGVGNVLLSNFVGAHADKIFVFGFFSVISRQNHLLSQFCRVRYIRISPL